jgi:hypothetical protein
VILRSELLDRIRYILATPLLKAESRILV